VTPERPRDTLGRPLPWDCDPAEAAPPVPDTGGLTGAQVWQLAEDYLARGMPFHAHEVFEQRWRTCPVDERQAWRAAAQWGAAETQAARGNTVGAVRLAQRAQETIDSAGSLAEGLDADRLTRACEALVDRRDGPVVSP
jgi:hypothetical protein